MIKYGSKPPLYLTNSKSTSKAKYHFDNLPPCPIKCKARQMSSWQALTFVLQYNEVGLERPGS